VVAWLRRSQAYALVGAALAELEQMIGRLGPIRTFDLEQIVRWGFCE
jgi:hypothetical protein